jgi:hypothetical protein
MSQKSNEAVSNDQQKVNKDSEGSAATTSSVPTNPYISVVGKRLRGLRKKLEHVASLEAKQASGQVNCRRADISSHIRMTDIITSLFQELNEDQLSTMANKDSLERIVQELKSMKQQFTVIHNEVIRA